MIKNIYALGAYQMSNNGFILDVVYENTEESGALTNYIPEGNLEGIPLIKIMNVDDESFLVVKVKEVMPGDASPVAMFQLLL